MWWVVGWLAIRLAKVFAIKILQRVVSADMLTDIIFIHSVSLESVHAAVYSTYVTSQGGWMVWVAGWLWSTCARQYLQQEQAV